MSELPKISDVDITGKKVIARVDLEYTSKESPRGKATDGIVTYLKEHGATKIKLVGHKGLKEMSSWWDGVEVNYDIRADNREMENSPEMAEELSVGWDVFVNESFAESHREYTSVNALPKFMKSKNFPVCIGLRFKEEIENLERVFPSASSGSNRPVVMVISGIKEDKKEYIKNFLQFADKILVGGRLPEYFSEEERDTPVTLQDGKLIIAKLTPDKEDITLHTIERFEKELDSAGTIVVSGPLGKFEDEGHRQGTEAVFKAVVENGNAFKVAGGGDTEKALQVLSKSLSLREGKEINLPGGFNWISVGGGAMLEFLANRTLPGIEALR